MLPDDFSGDPEVLKEKNPSEELGFLKYADRNLSAAGRPAPQRPRRPRPAEPTSATKACADGIRVGDYDIGIAVGGGKGLIVPVLRNAERQIQLETGRALQQIRSEAVDLSVSIASKIIQRNISKEDNERLIADALKQVEGRAN